MLRFALLLLILFIPSAAISEPLDRFAGRYRGCAVSGGELVPIETTLAVSGDRLSGSYIFIESSGRNVSGTIRLESHDGGDNVTFQWRDLYGEGSAFFDFTADGSRFDGYWTVETSERRFDWNGVRIGSDRTIPDCRTPIS